MLNILLTFQTLSKRVLLWAVFFYRMYTFYSNRSIIFRSNMLLQFIMKSFIIKYYLDRSYKKSQMVNLWFSGTLRNGCGKETWVTRERENGGEGSISFLFALGGLRRSPRHSNLRKPCTKIRFIGFSICFCHDIFPSKK